MSLTGGAIVTNELQGSVESGGELRGKMSGLKTIQGYSAYEVAVINGFSGTEAEWLASLKGEKGDPGYTPQKGVDYTDGYTPKKGIDYTDGYTPVKGVDYFDGEKGDPFTYEDFTAEQLADLKGDTGNGIKSIQRTSGNGAHGTLDTYTITMTDGSKTTFQVYNGKDGYTPVKGTDYFDGKDGYTPVKGKDYFDGKDGVSPAVSVANIEGGHRVTVTDASGSKNFDVMDGEDGNGVPAVTAADNGKFLRVVNGVWTAEKLTNVAEEGA